MSQREFWTTRSGSRALYRIASDSGTRSGNWTLTRHKGTVIDERNGGRLYPTETTWETVGTVVHSRGSRSADIESSVLVDLIDKLLGPSTTRTFWVKEDGMRKQYRIRPSSSGTFQGVYLFERNAGNAIGTGVSGEDTGRAGSPDSWEDRYTLTYSNRSRTANVASDVTSNLLDSLLFG